MEILTLSVNEQNGVVVKFAGFTKEDGGYYYIKGDSNGYEKKKLYESAPKFIESRIEDFEKKSRVALNAGEYTHRYSTIPNTIWKRDFTVVDRKDASTFVVNLVADNRKLLEAIRTTKKSKIDKLYGLIPFEFELNGKPMFGMENIFDKESSIVCNDHIMRSIRSELIPNDIETVASAHINLKIEANRLHQEKGSKIDPENFLTQGLYLNAVYAEVMEGIRQGKYEGLNLLMITKEEAQKLKGAIGLDPVSMISSTPKPDGTPQLVSSMIKFGTFSRFSHSSLYVGDGLVFESMQGGSRYSSAMNVIEENYVEIRNFIEPVDREVVLRTCDQYLSVPYSVGKAIKSATIKAKERGAKDIDFHPEHAKYGNRRERVQWDKLQQEYSAARGRGDFKALSSLSLKLERHERDIAFSEGNFCSSQVYRILESGDLNGLNIPENLIGQSEKHTPASNHKFFKNVTELSYTNYKSDYKLLHENGLILKQRILGEGGTRELGNNIAVSQIAALAERLGGNIGNSSDCHELKDEEVIVASSTFESRLNKALNIDQTPETKDLARYIDNLAITSGDHKKIENKFKP